MQISTFVKHSKKKCNNVILDGIITYEGIVLPCLEVMYVYIWICLMACFPHDIIYDQPRGGLQHLIPGREDNC